MAAMGNNTVAIIGGGLAGSEAALALAERGVAVRLHEMRPERPTPVHHTDRLAELVCSNSLKSTKAESAAGMLKAELAALGSPLYGMALRHQVPAVEEAAEGTAAVVLATGPLTSDALAASLAALTGQEHLAFFDAAAPIVMADSLDDAKLFRQSRYEGEGQGDYLNAPMDKGQYQAFIDALVGAERVMAHDFESRDLFQACQPIEEIARKGPDAPRFGTLKPVGLTDPRTGRRPWAALQLRAEDAHGTSYNMVGCESNHPCPEQRRAFRVLPGLEQAEFARYGVMHRNTFIEAPKLLAPDGRLRAPAAEALGVPVYVAGQLAGTEGYGEAIRSGLHVALAVAARLRGVELPPLPPETAFGALMAYATDPATTGYQPMHVNFGIVPPLAEPVRNKGARCAAYAERGAAALAGYAEALRGAGLLGEGMAGAAAAGFAGEAAEPGAGGEAPAEAAPAEGARR